VSSAYEILGLLFKYRPPFSIDQFFSLGLTDRKLAFVLDVISLIKSKHAVLNKRSSSLKPKSVTFKDDGEITESSNDFLGHNHKGDSEH
jgi:hypothetical protein